MADRLFTSSLLKRNAVSQSGWIGGFADIRPVDFNHIETWWCCSHNSAPHSTGADPMADLLKLAEEMKFSKKFEKVSLGQGQGPKAEKLLEFGMDRGIW
eukprot:scaffold245132_cov14-Tisochrysis_lutea.AAC.1